MRTSKSCSKPTATRSTVVEGDDPLPMHQAFAATLDTCYAKIRAIQTEARADASGRSRSQVRRLAGRPIVLRSLKGWTGPKVVDGLPVEGTFRAHQVPLANVKDNPDHLRDAGAVDAQLPAGGTLRPERPARPRAGRTRPQGRPAHGREPPRQRRHAHRRPRPARLPRLRDPRHKAGHRAARIDPPARQDDPGHVPAERETEELPALLPRRDELEPAGRLSSRSRTAARSGRSSRSTTTWPRTAG